VTTPGITAALGISGVRLNQLAREGRIPRGAKRGEWDLDAVRQAMARNIDVIHKERQAASTAARTPVRPPARVRSGAAPANGRAARVAELQLMAAERLRDEGQDAA
jgi:hypothetical protein